MTALVKAGDAGFGKALVEAAVQKRQDDFKTQIVAEVTSTMDLIERQEELIAALQKSVDKLKARVASLESGQFTVEGRKIKYPDNGQDVIYKDSLDYIVRNTESCIAKAK